MPIVESGNGMSKFPHRPDQTKFYVRVGIDGSRKLIVLEHTPVGERGIAGAEQLVTYNPVIEARLKRSILPVEMRRN